MVPVPWGPCMLRWVLVLAACIAGNLTTTQARPEDDRRELLQFRAAMQQWDSQSIAGWNASAPLCSWGRITCNSTTGEVTVVNMTSAGLMGTLPQNWALNGSFQSLGRLILADNLLYGPLPAAWSTNESLGLFPALYDLDFRNNNLSGTLPPGLGMNGSFPSLRNLGLNFNDFSGTLPPEWGRNTSWQSVYFLVLEGNKLTGTIPLEWGGPGSFPLVGVLCLDENRLTGSLPSTWAFSMPLLGGLFLQYNQLNGTFPAEWSRKGAFPSLRFLMLWQNQISGTLPEVWGTDPEVMPQFRELHASSNRLTGSLPSSYLDGTKPSIIVMSLHSNKLYGTLPRSLSRFYALDLADNQLNGSLPEALPEPFETWPQYILLSNNSFSGSIPRRWNSNSRLMLALSADRLAGDIPISWYDGTAFPNLVVLDVGTELKRAARSKRWRQSACLNASLYAADRLGTAEGVFARYKQVLTDITVEGSSKDPAFFGAIQQVPWLVEYLQRVAILDVLSRLSSSSRSIKELCRNEHVVLRVSLLWGAFLGFVVLTYLSYKIFALLRRRKEERNAGSGAAGGAGKAQMVASERAVMLWRRAKPLTNFVAVTIYWGDVFTDCAVLKEVWGRWPFYPLLLFLVLQFFLAAVLLCRYKGWSVLDIRSMCTLMFGFVLTPLVDMLVMVQDVGIPVLTWIRQDISLSGYTHSRDVIKAISSSFPTAVITSAIYIVGNRPDVGLILTDTTFVLSLAGSAAQLSKTWLYVFYRLGRGFAHGSITEHLSDVRMGKLLHKVSEFPSQAAVSHEAIEVSLENTRNSESI